MKKKLIGRIGVDSGQILIVDPCYLSDWKDNEFNYRTGIRNTKTGVEICCWDTVGCYPVYAELNSEGRPKRIIIEFDIDDDDDDDNDYDLDRQW